MREVNRMWKFPLYLLNSLNFGIENIMEGTVTTGSALFKRAKQAPPFQAVENLAKKRPSSTKLDIEKMYEESLELAGQYKKLRKQNQQLREQLQSVEGAKLERQNLIAVVQKIVQEKGKELPSKQGNHFSWLVFKLNNKIYDLRAKIQAKDKAIRDVTLSRQSQALRQKQTQIDCLNQIIEFAHSEGLVPPGFSLKDSPDYTQIKQIVWMEQQIKEKEAEVIESQKLYHQEQKQVRRLMQELANRKAELKNIKDMQNEYHRAQETYKQQKKKKQQRIAGNKTYLEQLQNQRAQQLKKLEELKNRYSTMEQQENQSIVQLQLQLASLKKEYEQKMRIKQQTVIKFSEQKLPEGKKKEVKRVTFEQVKLIGKNLSYSLKLKCLNQQVISAYFSDKEDYSIKQVVQKLKRYPFEMQKDQQALLLSRYVVQDTGDGYFLQDMDTSQSSCIIRSILQKVIGQIQIYTLQQAERLREHVGGILAKFGKLVQQSLDVRQGTRDNRRPIPERQAFVTKEQMEHALENSLTSLQNEHFFHQQIEFTIFYLFSWSRNLAQLEVSRLFSMEKQKIKWQL